MPEHTTDPTPRLRLLRNLKAICAQSRQRGDLALARAALDEEEALSQRIAELEKLVPTDQTPDQKEAA